MGADSVLAFDPGTKKSGWCLLERVGRRIAFRGCGEVASGRVEVEAFIGAWPTVHLVAVETPDGYVHEHQRGAHLLETRGVAERMVMAARALGKPVVELSAQRWRRMLGLGGFGTPGDTAVKGALRVLVADFPKRSNVHVRDAMGLGWVALTQGEGVRGVIARAKENC